MFHVDWVRFDAPAMSVGGGGAPRVARATYRLDILPGLPVTPSGDPTRVQEIR